MVAALIFSNFALVRASTFSSPKYSKRRNTSGMIATSRFPQMKSRIIQIRRSASNTF